jgi:hypothetical protein
MLQFRGDRGLVNYVRFWVRGRQKGKGQGLGYSWGFRRLGRHGGLGQSLQGLEEGLCVVDELHEARAALGR